MFGKIADRLTFKIKMWIFGILGIFVILLIWTIIEIFNRNV